MIIRVAFLILMFTFFCIASSITSHWVDGKVTIDGDNREWQDKELFVGSGIFISVANNDDNIFVSLRTNNEQLAQKFSLFGLTLWINNKGKKKKNSGILYPIEQKNPREIIKHIKTERNTTTCDVLGFTANRAGINYGDGNLKYMPINYLSAHKLETAVGCENALFTYELKIPLHSYDKDIIPFRVNKNTEEIRICFQSGSLDVKQGQSGYENPGMRMAAKGGGGGRPGGGKRAGGGMKGGAGRNHETVNKTGNNFKSQMMSPFSFWLKVKLADES